METEITIFPLQDGYLDICFNEHTLRFNIYQAEEFAKFILKQINDYRVEEKIC